MTLGSLPPLLHFIAAVPGYLIVGNWNRRIRLQLQISLTTKSHENDLRKKIADLPLANFCCEYGDGRS